MLNMKYVRIAMLKNDITIIELSKKLNVNVNTVSRWLNGNNLDNINKFIDMLKILDINVNDIKKE